MRSKIALTVGAALLAFSGLAFDVSSVRLICENPGNWRLEKSVLEPESGVTEIEVRLAAPAPETPPAFSVWCEVPQKDVPYVWRAGEVACNVPPVWGGLYRSQLASQMPVYSYFHADGQNALTLATSEAKRDVGFRCGVVEEGSKLRIAFKYFDSKEAPIAAYAVRVRFDARKVDWSVAVREASDWIAAAAKLTPADVPDAAFDPLYSTWYNFHQNLHADDIEAECAIAAKLGMKVLIVDDGWQTDDNGRGYAYCGDWQVSTNRFPDMAAHVARVHRLGMKYMMWYSVPFVGYKSANYARFKGKYLKNDDRLAASVLDPRFPEVREFLIGIYEKAVRDWDLDGLKLDFIGSFKGGCEDARGEGRDIDTVPEATDVLMKAVYARLKALKPDALVEFRQGYIGPAIRQYGNMLRVGDCPGDYQKNRSGIARLRLTSGTTAVHADMLEWNVAETPQEAARYVLNCLFGTIQYSMMLRTLPAEHLEMIRHWLGFSLAHRSALLKGDFRPLHPELNYPVLEGTDEKERIIGVYAADQVVRVPSDGRTAYVVNATPAGALALDCAASMTAVVFDTFGHETERFKVVAGVSRVDCPPSGYLKLGEKEPAFSCEGYETRPILSPWGEKVTPENAWREYPRPQMVRKAWTSLNGLWQYAIVPADEDVRPTKFDGEILVPFGPEAVLSGVRRKVTEKDQIWYRRIFAAEPRPGTRTLVNFECVDFRAQVFVNGREATDVPHAGSAAPFAVDVTRFLKSGENVLEVCAWDPCCSHIGTTGKQMLDPIGSFHPAESGICGSVWMETVPETYIRGYKVVTDIEDSTVRFELDVKREEGRGKREEVEVKVDGVVTTPVREDADGTVKIEIPNAELWSPENPKLYEFTAKCGEDEIRGYFGMRKFGKAKDAQGIWRFTLNGKFVYLLGALDQGWWPDGLLTPPSEEAVRVDVDFLKACGFNTIRKHIKVEPRVFYAHCDRVGMLVVQDMPCGGGDYDHRGGVTVQRWGMFRRELKDMVDSLRNHPSIVMWAPFNEGWGQPRAEKTRQTYLWLRDYDPTRLLDGPSGWNEYLGGRVNRRDFKGTTQVPSDPAEEYADAIDIHEYPGPAMWPVNPSRVSFLGEFGGTYAHVAGHTWLDQPTTVSNRIAKGEAAKLRPSAEGWKEKLASVYEGITDKLVPLVREGLGGSIYTQAQDVGIECGGFITYDRKVPKFDPEFLRKVHQRVYEAFDGAVGKEK